MVNSQSDEWVNDFDKRFGTASLVDKDGNGHFVGSYIIEFIDDLLSHSQASLLERVEHFFEPATGTRGQGGLPQPGTIKDWSFTVTKSGWKLFKQSLLKRG